MAVDGEEEEVAAMVAAVVAAVTAIEMEVMVVVVAVMEETGMEVMVEEDEAMEVVEDVMVDMVEVVVAMVVTVMEDMEEEDVAVEVVAVMGTGMGEDEVEVETGMEVADIRMFTKGSPWFVMVDYIYSSLPHSVIRLNLFEFILAFKNVISSIL